MDLYSRFTSPGGKGNPLTGGAIASGDSISPDYLVHHITGTGVIKTINLPYSGFNGPIYLISDDGFSFDNSGNIGTLAGTVSAGNVALFLYDLATNKWYTILPSLVPFTVIVGLSANIPISTTLTLAALDFIATSGGYSSFTVSKSQGGPYTATVDFSCPDIGFNTVYILGVQGSHSLELHAFIQIIDDMGYCTP